MALLWGGLVTFRTMIRQAAVAFAQALASSAQETLHSHTTAMMPVSCVTFLSFVSKTLVPNGQPMLTIYGALAGWGSIFIVNLLNAY